MQRGESDGERHAGNMLQSRLEAPRLYSNERVQGIDMTTGWIYAGQCLVGQHVRGMSGWIGDAGNVLQSRHTVFREAQDTQCS